MVTLTPSNCVGSTPLTISSLRQLRVVDARFAPKMEIHAPEEIPGWKLAAFTTPLMLTTGALTVSVTIIGCGAIPSDEIVMIPLYVPVARPPGATDMVTVDGAMSDAGVALNHAALELALQLNSPPPVFVTWIDCPSGFAPPML
jgi:hypothetical protein